MSSGYEVWQQYILIKTHFNNEKFDATKYNKPSGKPSTYNKRNDKSFFEYISKRFKDEEIKPFFISQFIEKDLYVLDIIDNLDDSIKNFRRWKKRFSRLTYIFENDCINIKRFMEEKELSFNEVFDANKNKYPIIMRLMMEKYITLETYVILEKIFILSKQYDKIYLEDHIYDEYSLRIRKYLCYFKSIDVSKYKTLLKSIFKG